MPLMVGSALTIFPLILIIFIKLFNPFENHRADKYFLIALIITLVESVLEILTLINNGNSQLQANISAVVNGIGFALVPFVTYFMIKISLLDTKMEKYKHILLAPLIVNAVISILSIWFNFIFIITPNNEYSRGPLFPVQFTINIIYFAIAVVLDYNKKNKYFKEERICIIVNYGLVLLSAVIQAIYPNLILVWSSAAIFLIFYYIILQNMQLRYDPLTNAFNRRLYKRELSCCNSKKGITIIVVDINCFKQINDLKGHATGDEILFEVANCLSKSFKEHGDLFRTGGDEFCLICEDICQDSVSEIMKKVEKKLSFLKSELNIDNILSYGYCQYDCKKDGDIINAVNIADKRMYIYKEQFRQNYDHINVKKPKNEKTRLNNIK